MSLTFPVAFPDKIWHIQRPVLPHLGTSTSISPRILSHPGPVLSHPGLNWVTLTRPPTEDGQKYMLAFRNLGLVTPCTRLALVFYLFRNLTNIRFGRIGNPLSKRHLNLFPVVSYPNLNVIKHKQQNLQSFDLVSDHPSDR
jgi:hypothetical protein